MSAVSELGKLKTAKETGKKQNKAAYLFLAPWFVGDPADATARSETVLIATSDYPILLYPMKTLPPSPLQWIAPATSLARSV